MGGDSRLDEDFKNSYYESLIIRWERQKETLSDSSLSTWNGFEKISSE